MITDEEQKGNCIKTLVNIINHTKFFCYEKVHNIVLDAC